MKQDTPNYGVEENTFNFKHKSETIPDKFQNKFSEKFIKKLAPLKSPVCPKNEFQMPTPTMSKFLNPYKPSESPSNQSNYNEMMHLNIQTPVRRGEGKFNMFSSNQTHKTPSDAANNFNKIFDKEEKNKQEIAPRHDNPPVEKIEQSKPKLS